MTAAEIIARIGTNATSTGFTAKEIAGFTAVWHRRKFMLTRVGMVDAVVTIRTADSVTRADLEDHERAAFDAALGLKTWIPRGLGSALEVHPITIADDADDSAVDHIRNTLANRWGAMTMPALLHGDPPEKVVFEGRKLWGALYVNGVRDQVKALMA